MTPLTTKAAEIRAGLVKPLEWRDMTYDGVPEFIAHHAYGSYTIKFEAGYEWPWTVRPFDTPQSNYLTLDEAKEAAQATYQTRILSALNLGLIEQQAAELAEARAENGKLVELIKFWIDDSVAAHRAHTTAESERDELLREKQRLTEERDGSRAYWLKAEAEAYELKYAAAGGEDAPGSAHAVTVADVDRWRRENSATSASQSERIAVLEAALRKKDEALKPFAAIADDYVDQEDDDFQVWRDFDVLGASLPLRHFRRARSALATTKEQGS